MPALSPPSEILICCNFHHLPTAQRKLALQRKSPVQLLDICSAGSGLQDDLLWQNRQIPCHVRSVTTYCRQAQPTPRSKTLLLVSQAPAIRIHVTSMAITNSLPLLVTKASLLLWLPLSLPCFFSMSLTLLVFYFLHDFPSCIQK